MASLLVVVILLIIFQVGIQQKEMQKNLSNKGSELSKVLAMASIQPILNYDSDNLNRLFTEAVKDKHVAFIRCVNNDGQTFAESEAESSGEVVEFNTPIYGDDDIELGQIRLGINSAPFEEELYDNILLIVVSLVVTAIVIAILIPIIFRKTITNPLGKLTRMMRDVGEGQSDLKDELKVDSNDEISDLAACFNMATRRFSKIIDETIRQSEQNLRIRTALDNVSSRVLVADAEHKIIYLNKSVTRLFEEKRQDFQQNIVGFDEKQLIGQQVQQLFLDSKTEKASLDSLNESFRKELKIGGSVIKYIFNPVINTAGDHLGSVVELDDRTEEVAVENEVANIIQDARSGELGGRIQLQGKHGFFKELSYEVNNLLDVLSSAISEISFVIDGLAAGILTQKVTNDYHGDFLKLKDGINHTVEQLEFIVSQILEAGNSIDSASKEIAQGNADLSKRTEQQAGNLDKTAASMSEITVMVRQNSDSAKRANEFSKNAKQLAEKGGHIVNDAVSAMHAINASSNKIAEIIGVIDDIAFQTNLLALNASVEAARAGEHGRGFAVVATEVRKLAQRSTHSAQQVKELIDDSLEKVKAGTKLVDDSGVMLEEIEKAFLSVSAIISEIAEGGNNQITRIEEVNSAISTMDNMTQQNAALAEQTTVASESLHDMSTKMSELMTFFTTSR